MRLRASAGIVGFVLSAASLAAASDERKLATLPLRFEPNLGQLDRDTDFVARMPGGHVRVHDGRFTLVAIDRAGRAAAVELELVGGSASAPIATEPLSGLSHHFRGDRKVTGVPGYARLRCPDVRPGVDLVLRGAGSQLEFDLEVAANAP